MVANVEEHDLSIYEDNDDDEDSAELAQYNQNSQFALLSSRNIDQKETVTT